MSCCAASFVDQPSASRIGVALARRKFPPVQVYLCGKCDTYHFRGSARDLRIHRNAGKVLRLCAMGFNADTIAEMTGYTKFSVHRALCDLRQSFGALNLPHLVMIATALGYLNPNEFIPPVEENSHVGT